MGKISNKRIYETVTPTGSDYLIGTDAEDLNKTKNFKIQAIADFVGQNVTIGVGSLNTLTGALTLVGGDGLTVTDNGSDTITISMDRPDYVESINSLIGAVDIVGSTNITITDNGTDTITVDTQNLAKTNEANTFVSNQIMTKDLSVGTTVFNVDSTSERVGINTSNPSKSLDVLGDTIIEGLTGDVLTLKSPSTDGENYILFTNSSDSDKGWVGYKGTSNVLQIDNLIDDIEISSLTGSVKLSLGASVKLQTIATGVDVNGEVVADSHVTNGGTSNDFVKGDGSLDSTDYQGQIDAEEAARIAADSALQSQITTNATDIDNEESARISADSSLQGQIDSNDTDITNLQNDKQDISEKGQANGYAPLDSGAKVAEAYLPDSILGQVTYEGTWDASTNTPTLANPPASTTKGDYYVTSVAGTQFGIDFQVGDWVISNGTAWEKVDNTDAVTSVFGRIGPVVANAGDYDQYYVNLDGDQTITGEKTFSGDSLLIADAGNGLKGRFKNTSIGSVQDSGYATFGFNGSNNLFFTKATSANFNGGVFAWDNNDAIRTYTLQDASGTLAFTSDINDTLDSVTDRGNTTTNSITVGDATINGDLAVDTDTLFVDSSNNRVGIGTDSPSGRFEVNGTTFLNGIVLTGDRLQTSGSGSGNYEIRSRGHGSRLLLQAETSGGSVGTFIDINPNTPLVTLNTNTTINGTLTLSDNFPRIDFVDIDGNPDYSIFGANGDFRIFDTTSGTDRMRIDSSGNIGIGITAVADTKLDIAQSGANQTTLRLRNVTNGAESRIRLQTKTSGGTNKYSDIAFLPDSEALIFRNPYTTERMRIDSSGKVGIGTTSPDELVTMKGQDARLHIDNSSGTNIARMGHSSGGGGGFMALTLDSNTTAVTIRSYGDSYFNGGNVGIGTNNPSATLDVNGSLSKNSGSFKIDHPLPSKKDTHHLVHSFVEAPQADNIYRGKVELSEGKATVNLDEAGRMTEGTFVLLNGNIQCFTSNESGWTATRGKVEGNILTIEAQDAECTDTISWLVIGERIDQHMIDTEWTDENGRVITEPLKKVEPTPESNEEEEATIVDNG